MILEKLKIKPRKLYFKFKKVKNIKNKELELDEKFGY